MKKHIVVLFFVFLCADVFAQTQAPEEMQGTWVAVSGKDEGKYIITATTFASVFKSANRSWEAEIVSWQEVPNEGKNAQDYPVRVDITLKFGNRTGPLQLFIHRDRSRFVMKTWLGISWNYPLVKQ